MKSDSKKIFRQHPYPVVSRKHSNPPYIRPVGFVYHIVSGEDLGYVKHLYSYKTIAEFESDLRYFKDNYEMIDYHDLLSDFKGDKSLSTNSAYLTFDDGFTECYNIVRPLLLKYEIPCIFFLTTSFLNNKHLFYRNKVSLCIEVLSQKSLLSQQTLIQKVDKSFKSSNEFIAWICSLEQIDEPQIDHVCRLFNIDTDKFLHSRTPFLTSKQVKEMQADGFIFGAHSRFHTRLRYLTSPLLVEEIVESCREISLLTGEDQVPFAFPFSGKGIHTEFLNMLRNLYSHIGLFFDTGSMESHEKARFNRIVADNKSIHNYY